MYEISSHHISTTNMFQLHVTNRKDSLCLHFEEYVLFYYIIFYEWIKCPDTFLGHGMFIQYDVNIVIFISCLICKSENVSMKYFKYVNI